MPSVNKVIIIGNLGADPITRYTPSGDQVTSISVATTYRWKATNGEDREETEWHRIVFFKRQAEVAAEFLKKGHPVYVEGSLQTKKWTDKGGIERFTTQIRAHNLQLLGRKEDADHGSTDQRETTTQRREPYPSRADERQTESRPANTKADPKKPAGKFDDMEDDIPFLFDSDVVLCEDQRLSFSRMRARRGLKEVYAVQKATIAV